MHIYTCFVHVNKCRSTLHIVKWLPKLNGPTTLWLHIYWVSCPLNYEPWMHILPYYLYHYVYGSSLLYIIYLHQPICNGKVVKVSKWIILVISISSDFWLHWLVHKAWHGIRVSDAATPPPDSDRFFRSSWLHRRHRVCLPAPSCADYLHLSVLIVRLLDLHGLPSL
jgi:hypothetical protein